jgi:hypothetical protein
MRQRVIHVLTHDSHRPGRGRPDAPAGRRPWPACARSPTCSCSARPGWDKYIGENGVFIGLKDFSLSAPAPVLFKYFGITSENVVAKAKEAVARRRVADRRPASRFGIDVVG